MKIRNMTRADLRRVAQLHKETLPSTVSSKIGPEYLHNLYNNLLSRPDLHIALVAYSSDELLGVITATWDLKKTQQVVRPTKSFLTILRITYSVLRRKVSISELLQRLYFEYKLLNYFKAPFATILTLFVHPSHRKKGVGRNLIRETLSRYKKSVGGDTEIFVDTQTENISAVSFYKKNGFKTRVQILDSTVLSAKSS